MIREARASVVKRAGGSIQHRLSAKFPPRSPELGSEEMQQLWTAFINSPYVNQLVTDRVPVDFNYNVLMVWACFLQNNHITPPFRVLETIKNDLLLSVKSEYRRTLSNLNLCKALKYFSVRDISYQMILPNTTPESSKFNVCPFPVIKTLYLLFPKKKQIPVLGQMDTMESRYRKATVDFILETYLDGYLYRGKHNILTYNKPQDVSSLMNIPEYGWYYNKNYDLRFLNNGTSLAVMQYSTYSGVVSMSDSNNLLKSLDTVLSKV